jgi:hypothetical protein
MPAAEPAVAEAAVAAVANIRGPLFAPVLWALTWVHSEVEGVRAMRKSQTHDVPL